MTLAHSVYLQDVLQEGGLKHAVELARDCIIDECEVEFEAIAVTGVSGMLLGPTLAFVLGKRLAVVRKEDDRNNHAMVRVEHNLQPDDRVIFVDDLIASGQTLARVEKSIDGILEGVVLTGYYLYHHGEFTFL